MTEHCKANPCCGDRPCSGIPLPQHASGLPFHNAPKVAIVSAPTILPMTAERAAYFLERFKREEKMLGPNEQSALDFAIAALAPPPPVSIMVGGLALISAERERQIAKGYDASHDDEHKGGEIIVADWGARARIEAAINAGRSGDSPAYKELLAEAAAQCVAEIDRVERAEGKANA